MRIGFIGLGTMGSPGESSILLRLPPEQKLSPAFGEPHIASVFCRAWSTMVP